MFVEESETRPVIMVNHAVDSREAAMVLPA
jgi:hypothetical protein